MLKSAVEAFQSREVIDNEIENLDAIDLCIALGGLPDQCAAYLRRLDEATKNK